MTHISRWPLHQIHSSNYSCENLFILFFFQVRLMSYTLCRELLVSQNHLLWVRLHWQCRWIATPTTYQDQCNPSCFKFLTQGHRGSCLYWVIAEGKKTAEKTGMIHTEAECWGRMGRTEKRDRQKQRESEGGTNQERN